MKFSGIILLLIGAAATWGGAAPATGEPMLMPPPQVIQPANGAFRLSVPTHIVAEKELEFEAGELRALLAQRDANFSNAAGQSITLKRLNSPAGDLKRPESYQLNIAPHAVEIIAADAVGIHYGIQTLAQWVRSDEQGLYLPAAMIRDWPDTPWRSAFLNLRFVAPGDESQQRLRQLIRGFAALKYNKLLVEVSDNLTYRNFTWPDRATPAFTHENLSVLVDFARQHHVELIPYLQTISHTLWVRSNQKLWEQIKEGGTVKMWDSQYCPSNPLAKQLIAEVIQEQLEVFRPRYFHIGLDEVVDGPFATCPVCREKDRVELYRQAVMDVCQPLLSAGVRPLAYQDGFAPRGGEAAERPPHGWKIIDQMPRELIINAWDYSPDLGESFNAQARWFTEKGFDVIGASYQRPRNVIAMPRAVAAIGRGLGTMLTYWYDVESWEKYDAISPAAWATTTLSAAAAWNHKVSSVEQIAGDLIAPLRDAMRESTISIAAIHVPIDLSAHFNARFGLDAQCVPGHSMVQALTQLSVSNKPGANNAIVLSGKPGDGLAAMPVSIPLNRMVEGLEFLHTCDRPFSNDLWNNDPNGKTLKPTIGRYQIQYAGGEKQTIELRYNWNITDWNSPFPTFDAASAWQGKTDDGKSHVLLVKHRWINPRPNDAVTQITFETAQNDGMSPVLLALGALTADSAPVVIDSFDDPSADVSRTWRILQEGFEGKVQARVLSEAQGRRGVLSLQMPAASSGASARLMLDKDMLVPDGATQISFWLYLESPDALGQSAVYIGNTNFEKHAAQFRVARLVKGWQQVVVSLESLKGISPEEVTQVRISLWTTERQPANTMLIDDVQWARQALRAGDARANWFD